MSRFIWENSLLISARKSSVTLSTPDPAQESGQQSQQKKQRVAGIGRHQLVTYKALGSTIANYAAPGWSTNDIKDHHRLI